VHFQSSPPKYRRAQRDIKDEEVKAKVIAKLTKVRERGYISPGMAESLTAFFEVEKGDDDICLVYDGSVSGLAACPFGCLASFCQQFGPIFAPLMKTRSWRMLTLGRYS
jgi:hypothetical protein